MGNKPVKGDKSAAAGSAPADTDEYWWAELEKNLRPIKSCEEFCERFNGLRPCSGPHAFSSLSF